ncbi:MAG: ATP-grasp domain-containing protein [Candidatus Gastranaerophilaceae bacterium]|jgi:carbamoyl-phosphate synthase large subunit
MNKKINVLIAGIAGASLGTEILKCLQLTKNYCIFGCDISNLAFGLYQKGFKETFLADPDNYIESIIDICIKNDIKYIIPGGEQPMTILGNSAEVIKSNGIILVSNSQEIINKFSDKNETFEILTDLGFSIPLTKTVENIYDLNEMVFPCIVKPAKDSGGSSFVFLAGNKEEAWIYAEYLIKNNKIPLLQEYIDEKDGEFTVGVLSLPNEHIIGSIALRRTFNSKLSISSKTTSGLISSGYSQGLIDEFPDVCKTAEKIAKKIKSVGPINIQGRIKNGIFVPFEINPRFSASTYLRAMAGFNEIDIYLKYLIDGSINYPSEIKYGYYMRSFCENFIKKEDIM